MVNTHTQPQPFNVPLSGTTRVGRYQKKHSPTHTHLDHQPSVINNLHLLRSTALSLFNLRAWQSFSTMCLHILFGLPLGLEPLLHTPFLYFYIKMPSVLWHCWLGGRKGIWPEKKLSIGCWRGYLSGVRCWLAYGPADATATHCLLLQ